MSILLTHFSDYALSDHLVFSPTLMRVDKALSIQLTMVIYCVAGRYCSDTMIVV